MLTNTSSLILTPAQAEAVYSAMCTLNNVHGRMAVKFPGGIGGYETPNGDVIVLNTDPEATERAERYEDQTAFAAAYGLDHGGEPQSAVAAAAGGLTQTAIER